MTRKELEKRAVILNVLELAFNEKQSIYGLEIEQASKSDNLFKCCLYDASTLEVINDFTSNYGTTE